MSRIAASLLAVLAVALLAPTVGGREQLPQELLHAQWQCDSDPFRATRRPSRADSSHPWLDFRRDSDFGTNHYRLTLWPNLGEPATGYWLISAPPLYRVVSEEYRPSRCDPPPAEPSPLASLNFELTPEETLIVSNPATGARATCTSGVYWDAFEAAFPEKARAQLEALRVLE